MLRLSEGYSGHRPRAAFRIFAARAAAELARLHLEQDLRDSEQRFRDLYDEAPIAYLNEDLESRFISANRAAMRILGITPEQVAGTVGMSFVPDAPEAQRRVKEAFASVGRGTDTSGVVLELRRRDNGKPIWIQWWSKPEPGGKYTRTMFVDITDRVLMEQEKARLTAQNIYLQEEIKSVHNFEEIIGQSSKLTAVLDNVRRVAPTDAAVLITGETGTGKELVARAIHFTSKRKDRPLIKVNCAALPSGLVESELFGHEKGAPFKVDVRVIAATNRDLLSAVREKRFREDLFYRLNVFPIQLLPLRERTEDIPLLAHFMVEKFAARIGKRIDAVSQETMQRLLAYPWPGNVRELENVLERAVILATGTKLELGPDMLCTAGADIGRKQPSSLGTLEDVERNHILTVLERTDWLIDGPNGAARILELHPNTLRSRMKKLGVARTTHEVS